MPLEDAIKAIREECNKHENCRECSLRTYDGRCHIKNDGRPSKWKLVSEIDPNIPQRLFS